MKLPKDEFRRSKEQHSLVLFRQGIRSKQTLEKYERTLKWLLNHFLEDILEGNFEERVSYLVKTAKEDPSLVIDIFLNISRKLRERTELPKEDKDYLNPNSFDNYFKPVKKLFDMNDVSIPWKKIYSTFHEIDNISDGRGWTRQEIQAMLKFARGSIDRAIVLVVASSGMRVGAFNLRWNDLVPVYKVGEELKTELDELDSNAKLVCAAIRIYKGSNEQYPAFITPEAYEALQEYKKEWTHQVGREPKLEEPIFKKEGDLPRMASNSGIKKRIARMIEKAGLRNKLKKGQRRHDVPIMNGFRRFWNKALEIDPKFVDALFNKGTTYHYNNYFEDAIKYYDKALEIDSDDVDILINKGACLSKLGLFDDAILCYDKALEIDPINNLAIENKMNTLNLIHRIR